MNNQLFNITNHSALEKKT